MAVFRTDPCGITCLILTYSAMFYADYVVIRHLVLPSMSNTLWGAFNVLVFNMIIFLMAVAHVRAVMSDPGIVPLPSTSLDFSDLHAGKQPMSNGWTVCLKCETYRPPRAHHCRICRRCIRRMDHHCPWINNCVGEFNQKYFLQFLFYVGVASVHATTLVIVSWILDPIQKGDDKHVKLVHSIILVIECLLFGLFVIAIGCDQLLIYCCDLVMIFVVRPVEDQEESQTADSRGHPRRVPDPAGKRAAEAFNSSKIHRGGIN